MILSYLERNLLVQREIDLSIFDIECDVLCIGAGCAGMYAALAAAKEGAKTVLVENDDTVGGMHILGNVVGYYYGASGGSYALDEPDEKRSNVEFTLQKALEKQIKVVKKLQNNGVKVLFGHTPTAVLLDKNRIVGARIFDGEHEIFINSKILIDATSDGHVIRMCGAKERLGKETDSTLAPFSVRSSYTVDGTRKTANYDAGYLNQYNLCDFSQKVIKAHGDASRVLPLGDFITFPTHTGVREGISFEGEEKLTYRDILFNRKPPKVLFYAYSDLDRHGDDKALYEEEIQNFWVISNLPTVTIRIAVPLGCVIPKGFFGIVSAGRCFCADSHALGAVRMVRDMFRMGECVGVAAALAVRSGCDVRDVNYEEYESLVRSLGCFAGDESKSFGFSSPFKRDFYEPISFNARDSMHLLKTDTPGVCIWSCYLEREDESLRDELYLELEGQSDELYRANLAIALGIMGDRRALNTLRAVVESRDGFTYRDCRRSNQLRSAISVCLLGRLGDASDVGTLYDIAFSDSELLRPMYATTECSGKNNVYFQMMSHALTSLVKIHKRCGIDTAKLKAQITEMLETNTALRRIHPTADRQDPIFTETASLLKFLLSEIK